MSSKNFNSFKDFQSDQIQTSSRKLFTAHYACSNSDLNLTLVTGTTNGFIFQIIGNSLIESCGVRLACLDSKITVSCALKGSKGWRSGESARLPPMWPGFKSRRRRHMWVEFVVGSLLCSERFFSGYSGFPFSSKTSIFKFQFDQESGRRRTTLWIRYLQILFIYLDLLMLVCFLCSLLDRF